MFFFFLSYVNAKCSAEDRGCKKTMCLLDEPLLLLSLLSLLCVSLLFSFINNSVLSVVGLVWSWKLCPQSPGTALMEKG